jgi:hypothetical protein
MAAAYAQFAPYLWAGLIALVIVLIVWVVMLQSRVNHLVTHYNSLLDGASGDTLLNALDRYVARLDETIQHVNDLDALCHDIETAQVGSVQKIGVVRFNPFNDTGSDQSFAVALLDAKGSGVVLSSLFSRASTRIFAKAISDGTSVYPLTDEEREAIDQALGSSVTLTPQA